MDTVRIGIIGTGSVAQVTHLPILSRLPDVDLAGICDVDEKKVRSIAARFGIRKIETDYRAFLEDDSLDAIIIATPTDMHAPIGKAALEAGKSVLIEKPIARTSTEAQALADAAKRSGKLLMVGMNHRFRQDITTLKNFIANGELGNIFYVRAGWLNFQSSTQKWMRNAEKSGGGVFIDLGIVMVDLGLWLLNFPKAQSVSSTLYHHKTRDVEDTACTFIRLQHDITLSIDVSWTATVEENNYYCDIIGTKGSARINPLRIHKLMAGNPVNVTPVLGESSINYFKSSYEHELKHFIGAVRGLYPGISTGEEAVQRMKLVEAVYQSASKRKEIILK